MAKTLDEPIIMLEPDQRGGAPLAVRNGARFMWRDREHSIDSVGGHWSRRGRWWLGEGYRRYFRITTLENMALDLCYDELAQSWTIADMMD